MDITGATLCELFCHETERGYTHFYPSREAVAMCGEATIVPVRLYEDPDGAYWCWHAFERDELCMVYSAEVFVDMCFPYGYKAAQDRGKGRLVRVSVTRLDG